MTLLIAPSEQVGLYVANKECLDFNDTLIAIHVDAIMNLVLNADTDNVIVANCPICEGHENVVKMLKVMSLSGYNIAEAKFV